MYNYFMLIGYVVFDAELREVSEGKRVISLRIAVKREFQNMDGEYETDFINVTIWDFLATNYADFLKKGSKVALKGRICPKKQTIGEMNIITNELYVERIVFLEGASYKEVEVNSKASDKKE